MGIRTALLPVLLLGCNNTILTLAGTSGDTTTTTHPATTTGDAGTAMTTTGSFGSSASAVGSGGTGAAAGAGGIAGIGGASGAAGTGTGTDSTSSTDTGTTSTTTTFIAGFVDMNGCTTITAEDHTWSNSVTITKMGNAYKPSCLKVIGGVYLTVIDDFQAHPLRPGVVDANNMAAQDAVSIVPVVDSGTSVLLYEPVLGTFGFYCASDYGIGEKGAIYVMSGPPLESMQNYCNTIRENCTGSYQQYDAAIFGRDCEKLSKWGLSGWFQSSGLSVGCHLTYAGKAAMNPAQFCDAAGPLSSTCGTPCENFCHAAVSVCYGVDIFPPDTTIAQCLVDCQTFLPLDQVPYNFSAPALSGDSLACRMHYLDVAAMALGTDAANCLHVATVSDVCN